MRYELLKKRMENKRKGTFGAIVYERPMKTLKAFSNDIVVKRTRAVVRTGVTYDNIKAVQEKRADGTYPSQNQGLTWGEWIDENFIGHKGNKYLRVYLGANNTMDSKYFVNGRETSKEVVQAMCVKSEFGGKTTECLTINVENIISF